MEKVYGVIYNNYGQRMVDLCEDLDKAKKTKERIQNNCCLKKNNLFVPIEVITDEEKIVNIIVANLTVYYTASDCPCDVKEFSEAITNYVESKKVGCELLKKKFEKLFCPDKFERKDFVFDDWEFSILKGPHKIEIMGICGWDYGAGTPEFGVFGHSNTSLLDAYNNIVNDIKAVRNKHFRNEAYVALENIMDKYLK